MAVKAVLDANVLYGNFSRDLLMSLFAAKMYDAKWTDMINSEWVEHLLENRPNASRERIEKTVKLMGSIRSSTKPIVRDFEYLISSLEMKDSDDRHVVAAAIASKATRIVTWNLKDFPRRLLDQFSIHALSPDSFIIELIEADADGVVLALAAMRKRMQRPLTSVSEFFEALDRNNMKRTRIALEKYRMKL